jgi:hypothetical protein
MTTATATVDAWHCVSFVSTFFNLEGLIPDIRRRCRMVLRDKSSGGVQTLAPMVEDWNRTDMPITEGSLTDLRSALSGTVCVLPWIVLKARDGRVGPINDATLDNQQKLMPGFWVDVPGLTHPERSTSKSGKDPLEGFLQALDSEGAAPTFVTQETRADIRGRWRLWWALEGHEVLAKNLFYEPRRTDAVKMHLAWFAYVQSLAIRTGFARTLPVDPRFGVESLIFGLPGLDSTVIGSAAPMHWPVADRKFSRYLDQINLLQRELDDAWGDTALAQSDVLDNLPWDDILTPVGWEGAGVATNNREHYWKLKGTSAYVRADRHELRFWDNQGNWLTGLKEASDAGIRLDRRVVACLLGWDGDVPAFTQHWERTGRLYPHA